VATCIGEQVTNLRILIHNWRFNLGYRIGGFTSAKRK
jgi:hypothetical protein